MAKSKQFQYGVRTFQGPPETVGAKVDGWLKQQTTEDFKIFKIVKDPGDYGDIIFNVFYREIRTEQPPPGELVHGGW